MKTPKPKLPPPVPTEDDRAVQEEIASARRRGRFARGQRATIATSPLGAALTAKLASPTLRSTVG